MSRGNLWDLAVLYPKQALWQRDAPRAIFADGPVAKVQTSLADKLNPVPRPAN